MTAHPYSLLIRCKQWADQGLYETILQNFDRLDRVDASIMPRILDHIHVVDRIFQHHLQGRPHAFGAPRSNAAPDIETLFAGAKEVDAWYVAYVDGLPAAAFDQPVDFVFTSGKPARMTRGEILLHVCLHGNYHRGNAGILLQKSGSSPYRDGITDYLEDTAPAVGEAPAA
jgi:uncharacterized damage-inducible protein DinB